MTALEVAIRDAARELELEHAANEQREIELTATEKAERDPLGWLNSGNIVIQSKFDQHGHERQPQPMRLQLYPAQVESIEAWIDLDHLAQTGTLQFRNVVIEKSRQIGETWGFAAMVAWILHYHSTSGGYMHTRQTEVDDGGAANTTRSFFGKVRYIDQRLNRDRVAGLGRLVFRPFSNRAATIENPASGSIIYGEGQKDDPFRGATLAYFLGDETAFVAHGEKVHASVDEACPRGKVYLSTVNGDGNVHARIADEKPYGWRYLRLHWSQHPLYSQGLHVAGELDDCRLCQGNQAKIPWSSQDPQAHRYPGKLTSPWYDTRVIGKTDEQVANELDIDRGRALAGRVYAEFDEDQHVVQAGIAYSEDVGESKLELAWDYGLDVTSVVVCQDAPMEYRVIGELEMGDKLGTTATPDRVARELRRYLVEVVGLRDGIAEPKWTNRIYCIGDRSGVDRSVVSGTSVVDAYARQGFRIGAPPNHLVSTVSPSIAAVKRLLLGTPKPLRVCAVKCPGFIAHMRNNRWPTDAQGQRTITATRPEDDEHNHMMRAFAYLAVTKFPPPRIGPGAAMRPEQRRKRDGILTGISYDMSF